MQRLATAIWKTMIDDRESVEAIAEEISRYLADRADAADTLEGIKQWWLARIRIEEAALRVKQALDSLVQRGVVLEEALPDGSVLYRSALR
jgi:hypothetical protein